MKESWLRLEASEGSMRAFLAAPEAPKAGVVVVQEAFGVNPHIQDVCRRLAESGFCALAPELYHRAGPGLVFDYTNVPPALEAMGRISIAGLLEDLQDAFSALRGLPELKGGKLGVLGFCMGGYAAVLAASRFKLDAAVAFYPGGLVRPRTGVGLVPIVDEAKGLKTPLLALFGAEDPGIPESDVAALRSALAASGKEHEVLVYPGAGHGFYCDRRASYHPPSAEAAWARVRDWLTSHLG